MEENQTPNEVLIEEMPQKGASSIDEAIFGFNGRGVHLNIGEKWVRIEGNDRAMLVSKLSYSYAFSLGQVASIEQVSLKPNGMVSLSITLIILAIIALTSIDARLVEVVFKEYSVPSMIRMIVGIASLAFGVLAAVYYLMTTTSVVIIQMNSGENLTFYANPKNARNLWQTLRNKLSM